MTFLHALPMVVVDCPNLGRHGIYIATTTPSYKLAMNYQLMQEASMQMLASSPTGQIPQQSQPTAPSPRQIDTIAEKFSPLQ